MATVGAVILRVSDGLVVVAKPPGLASTGRDLRDPDCAQHQVMLALGGRKPVWAVHRLDKDTSGLILFVTRKSLVAPWAARLHAGGEVKRYLAVCHGELAAERLVDAAIGRRVAPDGRTFPALVAEPAGKAARTRVIPVAVANGFSLVEARPLTGRTHQVRLHLAAIGHPLVGEALHRDPPCRLHPRHALHAWALALGPPYGTLEAPLPEDLRALLARLGLPQPACG